MALKTIGLFALMAQCGLHIPADPESEIGVFEQIFVDIGDEQSIEQSLSTFSSHMSNIVGILPRVNEKTLVLLDELGAGTDPSEGSSLAMAILEFLLEKGCLTIATTHYSELKTFAYSVKGIENASVEFDSKTLQPTYRLLVGVPGRSNAFDIAARLGLNGRIVNRAQEFLSSEEVQVADLIENLEENRRITEQERKDAEAIKKRLQEEKQHLESRLLHLENREKEILSRANSEARKIIRDAHEKTREILQELRAELNREAGSNQERAAAEARRRLKETEGELEDTACKYEPRDPGQPPEHVYPGLAVEIPRLKQKGTVVTHPDAQGDVQVQVGPMRINVKGSHLRSCAESSQRTTKGSIGLTRAEKKHVSLQKDLRGLTLEEAIIEVDKYLDDVYLAGLKEVSLIHGKGTGALRRGLTEFLEHHPQVTDFRPGGEGEGGSGVTVVRL